MPKSRAKGVIAILQKRKGNQSACQKIITWQQCMSEGPKADLRGERHCMMSIFILPRNVFSIAYNHRSYHRSGFCQSQKRGSRFTTLRSFTV